MEEVTDLTEPDQDRITRRAGALLEQFKELVYPPGYDFDKTSTGKRKVGNNKLVLHYLFVPCCGNRMHA